MNKEIERKLQELVKLTILDRLKVLSLSDLTMAQLNFLELMHSTKSSKKLVISF